MATKRCSKCGIEKELSEFHKEKKARDGHFTVCKECRNFHIRKYYAYHKGRRGEITRKYRNAHKEQILKYNQEYHRTHKVEERKYHHERNLTHKEENAKQQREYDATPNGKAANKRKNHKRRALSKATEANLTADQWVKILNMQNNRCNGCGKLFTARLPPETDHIIPLSRGGGLTFENVQALCGYCNKIKSNSLDPQIIQTWL